MAKKTQLDPRNYESLPLTANHSGQHKLAHHLMDIEKAFICERCGKPVQQVSIKYGYNINGYQVVVFCHGETDECFLDREFIYAWCKDPNAWLEKICCFQNNKLKEPMGYLEHQSQPDLPLPPKP